MDILAHCDTATHCNTRQKHCNSLQGTTTNCNTDKPARKNRGDVVKIVAIHVFIVYKHQQIASFEARTVLGSTSGQHITDENTRKAQRLVLHKNEPDGIAWVIVMVSVGCFAGAHV